MYKVAATETVIIIKTTTSRITQNQQELQIMVNSGHLWNQYFNLALCIYPEPLLIVGLKSAGFGHEYVLQPSTKSWCGNFFNNI